MQLGQGVDQLLPHPAPRRLPQPAGEAVAHHHPVHPLHQVEGRADHRPVLAGQHRPGGPHPGPLQGRQHPVLAEHVVGGREEGPGGGPAEDPLVPRPADEEGLVGVSRPMALDLEGPRPRQPVVEEPGERLRIDQRIAHASPPVASFVVPSRAAALSRLRAMNIRCTSDGPS